MGAAGFAGAVGTSDAGLASDCTDPEGVAFTPPGVAGWSAVGLGAPSDGGVEGGLISSGIVAKAQTFGAVCVEKNDNF